MKMALAILALIVVAVIEFGCLDGFPIFAPGGEVRQEKAR